MSDKSVASESPDEPTAVRLRLLTLNLGLLDLKLLDGLRVGFAAQLGDRLAAAPTLLSGLDADVIALQEVYSPQHRRFLARAMATQYPFLAQAPPMRSFIGNGLMLLSRFPILHAAFVPCRGAPWWSRLCWRQGYLVVDIELPITGRVRIVNAHIAASLPFADPDGDASLANRRQEIDQLLAVASSSPHATILLGDFNAGPEVYPEGYRRLIAAGYIDAFAAANASARNSFAVTWDAANPLNARGRFRGHPSQRIDHVFVQASSALAPVAARVVLRDQTIKLKSGQRIPLSDHYGIFVTLST